MNKLKEKIRKALTDMLLELESEHYKCEADRFGDIAEDAEKISRLINESDVIDWDE